MSHVVRLALGKHSSVSHKKLKFLPQGDATKTNPCLKSPGMAGRDYQTSPQDTVSPSRSPTARPQRFVSSPTSTRATCGAALGRPGKPTPLLQQRPQCCGAGRAPPPQLPSRCPAAPRTLPSCFLSSSAANAMAPAATSQPPQRRPARPRVRAGGGLASGPLRGAADFLKLTCGDSP